MSYWFIAAFAMVFVPFMGLIEYKARERYTYAYYQEAEAERLMEEKKIDLFLRNGLTVVIWIGIAYLGTHTSFSAWWVVMIAAGLATFGWNFGFMVRWLYRGYEAKRTTRGRTTLRAYAASTLTAHERRK